MSSAIIAAASRHARRLPVISLGCRALGSSAPAAASPSSGAYNAHNNIRDSTSLLTLAAATSVVAAYSISSLDNNIAFCEAATGPADVMEDSDDIVVVEDGMDAGVEDSSSPESTGDAGPADAEEEEDEDDPSNDEETSCSICLINRQGPCRKYWLKFERCMKEHSAEKEKTIAEAESKEAKESKEESKDDTTLTEQEQIEREWDAFMEKSIQPGEDDDDDDGKFMCNLLY